MAQIHLVYFDLKTGYYPDFHHGLAYIIGALKADGYKVSLSHLSSEDDLHNTAQLLLKEKPDLIGLSFLTNQKKYVSKFIHISKLPAKLTVAGGVHPTLAREQVFIDFPEINGICIGEGEIPLRELCRRFYKGEDYLKTPSFYFRVDGQLIKNPIAPLQDIDSLYLPEYALFDYRKILDANGWRFTMMLSRGCPYSCSYCCNHVLRETYPNKHNYVRFHSVSRSIIIIKNNLLLYPRTQRILFADDIFTLDPQWLADFCERYRKEVGLPFLCNARVETVNDDVIASLRRAGCTWINFGVESGNEWLREHILKRLHSNEKIKEAFVLSKKHGIKTFSFNMVGLPFETKSMAIDTMKLNRELRPNYGKCFYFFPYIGTELHQLCVDYGLLGNKVESVSGYLEAASLKGIFMPCNEVKRIFQLMNSFFYVRLVSSKLKLPLLLEEVLHKIIFFSKVFLLIFSDPNVGERRYLKKIKNWIRSVVVKYAR